MTHIENTAAKSNITVTWLPRAETTNTMLSSVPPMHFLLNCSIGRRHRAPLMFLWRVHARIDGFPSWNMSKCQCGYSYCFRGKVMPCLHYFWTHPMLPHPWPRKTKTWNKMHDLCFYPVCICLSLFIERSSAWRRMHPSTAHPQCFHHVWSHMVARFAFAELLRKHVKVGFWFKHVFFSRTCFSQGAENCALNMMRNQRFCWGGVGWRGVGC